MKIPHPIQKSALTVLVLAAALAVNSVGFAQEKKTPEKKENAPEKKELFVKIAQDEEPEYLIGMLLEYFLLDHRTANRLIRTHAPKATDAAELRDELEQLIDEESAELLETVWLPTRGDERGKTESIQEVIYPTEYNPPVSPKTEGALLSIEAKDPEQQLEADQRATALALRSSSRPELLLSHGLPSAFETRNVGVTLEADPVLGTDRKAVSLSLAPEIVTHLGYEYYTRNGREDTAYGIDHMRMPLFYTMKTTTSVSVVVGNENLLAIHTPPNDPDHRVLVMLRVDLIPVK